MSTTSPASKNLYENESNILVLPDHSLPITESSSTVSLESSTTAEVSSKSPSLLGVPSLKESHKSLQFCLSPLSTSFESSPLSSASITSASKLSTSRFSPPESSVICESFQQRSSTGVLKQEFIVGQNMLANTGSATPPSTTQSSIAATSSSNSPAPVATSCSSSLPPSSVSVGHLSSSNNNVHNIKREPQLTPSPTGGVMTIDNARIMEETTNKNNSSSSDTSSGQQRECSSVMQRKNSNSSISANGTGTMLHTSPTSASNNNDNSNSSNSTISQIMDADAIVNNASQQQQQQQHPNESNTNGSNKATKTNSVDDSNDSVNINPSASGSFPNASASKENSSSSTSSSSSSSSSSVSGKDDSEIHAVLGNLASVKKEQHNVETPEMSPDGFGSLPTLASNNNSASSGVGVTSGGINNNNSNGKSTNLIGVGCGLPSSAGTGGPGGCISSLLNEGSSNGQQPINSNFSGNVSIMPNSMDYMQQQNHIFVFSTQLANKGAESVLSGQFPTIIAYHCTQPATKKFLEDFFLKNPMKMAKIQRQNSLNMAISVSTGHQWMGGGGSSMPTKQQQKTNGRNNIGAGNITNNPICNNSAMDEKSSTSAISASSSAGFPEAPDSLSGEADLMNWEQSSIGLENITNNSNAGHSIKIGDGPENIEPSQNSTVANSTLTQQSPHKTVGIGGNTAPVSPGDSMQPSLQGVKVPDENLTPQQRQHREEQLAKLKKMNQFLFPEHGGELLPDSVTLQGQNQLAKLNTDGIIGNPSSGGGLVGILGESSGNSTSLGGGNNQLPNSRGTNNLIGMGRGSGSLGRSGVNLGSEESGLSSGIIGGPGDMNNIHCGNQIAGANNLLMNTQQGLSCGPGNIPMPPNSLVGGMGGTLGPNQSGIMSHGNISGMNSINHCGPSGAAGGLMLQTGPSKGMGSAQQMDIVGGGPSQMQWSKMQHQFYEERSKGNKGGPDIMAGITGLCRSISSVGGSYVRSSQPGPGGPGSTISSSGPNGRSQGPPPPYHPTQRSASVPIATQSPNPSSPNNPTSNLSLPSPRTASGSCGTTLNSPSSDGLVSASASSTPTTSAPTIAAMSGTSNSNNQCKAFQQEDSPTGSNSNNLNGGNNNLRSNISQFNSNPSTPLSNMSPKDMESLGATGIMSDVKNPRPSPQRSRTPHVAGNNNSEPSNMEGRFPPASPGVNFPSHMQGQGSGPKMSSGGADNQTSTQASFGRRPDNLPLNPNSSRPPPIKQNHHFDPISSLAQMSQQLTSCVSSNGGVSGPSSVGISSSMSSEMPIGGSGHQNMDGLMVPGGPLDSGMDHCGNVPGNSGGMGMSPHMMVGGQYGAGGCHMGGPLGPMGSRLLAPKGGGSFGAGPGGMRDGLPGFHGGMPTHRMMGRMGVNFCPFNGSPNIQVKASTPNTIQYMPVRPQTNNTNPRVPPSLEFLQRFANPQLSGCPNIGDGPMGPMGSGPGGNADPNKMPSNSANPSMPNAGMNFFQNCNQLGAGSSPGNINGGNQVDMAVGMMSGHSDMAGIMNMGGNPSVGMNIRGMRPVRQGGMGPGGSPVGGCHRMQGPGSHLIGGPGVMNQFGNNPHEVMECVNSDPNGMFGNVQGGPNQMFGPQQKGSPMGGQAHCQNISPANVGINGPLGANEQNSAMQGQLNGPGMLGGPNANGSIANGNGPGPGSVAGSANSGPSSYKPYMGQSSNDLKYAQQYHNFQQQLYATSTRSQVSQQIGGSQAMGLPGSGINSGIPTNSNPGFFVSK